MRHTLHILQQPVHSSDNNNKKNIMIKFMPFIILNEECVKYISLQRTTYLTWKNRYSIKWTARPMYACKMATFEHSVFGSAAVFWVNRFRNTLCIYSILLKWAKNKAITFSPFFLSFILSLAVCLSFIPKSNSIIAMFQPSYEPTKLIWKGILLFSLSHRVECILLYFSFYFIYFYFLK